MFTFFLGVIISFFIAFIAFTLFLYWREFHFSSRPQTEEEYKREFMADYRKGLNEDIRCNRLTQDEANRLWQKVFIEEWDETYAAHIEVEKQYK